MIAGNYIQAAIRKTKNILFGRKIKVKHSLQVTSFGGVGTSFLINYLKDQNLHLPKEFDCGIWKHMRKPPTTNMHTFPKNFRVIYLFGDPVDAILSVFRRNFHAWHIERIESQSFGWPSRFLVLPDSPKWDLYDFVQYDKDLYGLREHFINWTTVPHNVRSYPILAIRYETLWDNLDALFRFVNLPEQKLSTFPLKKPRKSLLQNHSPQVIDSLKKIYKDLSEQVEAFPDVKIY